MPKRRSIRRPKRTFSGNHYTTPSNKSMKGHTVDAIFEQSDDVDKETQRSISAKKIMVDGPKPSKTMEKDSNLASLSGYHLLDMEILSKAISSLRCG